MKKWIFILGTSLILTGCSKFTDSVVEEVNSIEYSREIGFVEYSKEKDMYINEDMKNIILEINNLREKYKDVIDERGFNSLYINTYGNDNRRIKDINFNNKDIYSNEYFYDLVEILDKSSAEGLKDYITDMKDKQLSPNKIIIEKIGRSVVYIENRMGNKEKHISIKINFLDVEDEYYRKVFNKVSDDKYILDDVIIGERLNVIEFIDPNNAYNIDDYNDVNIRYNMFLEDKDIKKANIFVQGKKGVKLKDDDISVFVNLLNSLELNEKDKNLLVNEYKNIFEKKVNSKKISVDNHNVFIKYNKGNTYAGKNSELIYFSIERN